MIEIYSRKIAIYFSTIGIIPSDKIETYRFYLETCCYKLIIYGISVLIFVALDRLLTGLIFLCMFMGLRMTTGGYHTKKALSCLLLSPFIITLNMFILIYLPTQAYWMLSLGFVLAIMIILKWAPLSNENNVLTECEIKASKQKCKIWVILTSIAIILFRVTRFDLCLVLMLAYINDAILLFIGIVTIKLKERGECNET